MRLFMVHCGKCEKRAHIKKTVWITPDVGTIYCACTNVECGHTFTMSISFSHTLSPSALDTAGVVKTLIDCLSPEQRKNTALILNDSAKHK
ncbi:ogr/Delta-like zinc finger family protein [Enterobacter sp. PTB]|uniref:ogr/Delta-like zinc finger family protein n=1 Tax=Enterobacter sp. PTB TaxID=3143437 RepID=UPI003DA7ED8C